MEIDFELFGDITDARLSLLPTQSENCANCARALATDVGESVKGLPMCASAMVRYGLPKCIGYEAHGIGKVRMKIKRYLD